VNLVAGLERQAARVVHDALADQGQQAGGLALGAVDQLDHRGRLSAAEIDAEQTAAAQLDQRLLVEDLDFKTGLRPQLGGEIGELRGGQNAAGGARQIAGQLGSLDDDLAAGRARLGVRDGVFGRDQAESGQLGFRTVLTDAIGVPGQRDTFDNRSSCVRNRHQCAAG